ncbi:MAG: beta-propeller fold lactonase family protein [Terriglobales bacterium]
MTFRRAAQAALASRKNPGLVVLAVALVLAGLSASCGSKSSGSSGASHNAYITLPQTGQVMLLHINNSTGAISSGPQTPPVVGNSPNGVVLHPSGKFLYAINSDGNSISIFNVAADGTLTLSATPTPACCGPHAAAIDSTGNYLLVSNTFSNDVSVFAIASGGGTLSPVQSSPFPAGPGPTDLKITGELVYVVNPGIGKVEAFSLNTSNGFLTSSPNSPFTAGAGLNAIAIDPLGHYLYTANSSDKTFGTVSAFQIIDPATGDLKEIRGSPYCSTPGCTGAGSGPGALAVDPSGKFLYVSTPGSTSSIWGFTIAPGTGQLAPVANSPFSLSAGTLFLLMEPNGKFFYIGDQAGSNIAGYSYDPSTGAPTAITGSPFSTPAPGGMLITH